jgi:beta-lactamase superfamily II metal-dependent hydrolase
MRENNFLRLHFLNVGHGDAIVCEFPDYINGVERKPRFGLIDAGGLDKAIKEKTLDYLNKFIRCRLDRDPSTDPDAEDYIFEFICLSHPHEDHLKGMLPVLEAFCADGVPAKNKPRRFWDCGFRYNTVGYLDILNFLIKHREVQFVRVASGTEFHFDAVEIVVLAPSIDLRNRYDTYGVNVNDASIVLRLSFGGKVAVLTGDSHFDTWGKICEEFPRTRHITYAYWKKNGKIQYDKRDPRHPDLVFLSSGNQLDCDLLKVAHHGSKRGTSYEYIEKLSPDHFAITCDNDEWYSRHKKTWVGKFPHPITRLVIGEETDIYNAPGTEIPSVADLGPYIGTSCNNGTMIYTIDSDPDPEVEIKRNDLSEERGAFVTKAQLEEVL